MTARSIRRNTQIQCKRACLATVVNAMVLVMFLIESIKDYL